MKFPELQPKPDFPYTEKTTFEYWEQNKIEQKIQESSASNPPFTFLEGPPTANGLPHVGHLFTRVIKDVYLRYKTMTGYFVTPRIGGWDCHGLPVEIEVEKELGLESKEDIEAYGVEKFIQKCRVSVLRYVKEWENMSTRGGFHLDMPSSYVTMSEEYVESVWWSLKTIYDKGLLFKGHKVLPYCTRCGTPLSSHEVAQGYQETEDPSIYLKFKLRSENDRYFLAWTTTPWTLLSNMVLAIAEDETYLEVKHNSENLIFAKALLTQVFPDGKKTIVREFMGKDLLGMEYEPLFQYTKDKVNGKAHFVVAADFVSMEEGTGIVHCAPAYGQEDYELCKEIGVEMFHPVLENGNFVDDMPKFGGLHVKKADPLILEQLRADGKLLREELITHTYPFCWRCDSPLLYYALDSWFIGMSRLRKKIQALNQQIRWMPKHMKDGRFGNFLDELKDWSLSRTRYWGTPLPIWTCDKGHEFAIGSREELEKLTEGGLPVSFSLHKPDVDLIKVKCPDCEAPAIREEYVIDCWYDSGAATFAQWHYPFENQEAFKEHFPIDFITEAIDQTRGWFYSLLAISTVIFEQPAYKTCLTMGHIQTEDGKKMSKSRGNVYSPDELYENYGADPARWLLFSTPTWNDVRFSFDLVEESMKEFMLPLWNVLSFFVTYANLDNYSPNDIDYQVPVDDRPLIDRWILSRFHHTVQTIRQSFDDLSVHLAIRALQYFLNQDMSNLWVRQSRRRFWEKKQTLSKRSAYATMYEILTSLARVLAPFIPFFTEEMYRILVKSQNLGVESVHLESYPEADTHLLNTDLEAQVAIVRDVISTGRAIRSQKNIKTRWPLSQVIFVANDNGKAALTVLKDLVTQELNVKEIIFTDDPLAFQEIEFAPNFEKIGPKYKNKANNVATWMRSQKGQKSKDIANLLNNQGSYRAMINGEEVFVEKDDLEIRTIEKEGYTGASFDGGDLFLNLELTEELINEGFVRDLIRRIQSMRKDLQLPYDAEITLNLNVDPTTSKVIENHSSLIKSEVLASRMEFSISTEGLVKEWTILDPTGTSREVQINIVP